MKTNTQIRSGVSAPQNSRQNWATLVVAALALVGALLNPVAGFAQPQVQGNDAMAQVGTLRTQVGSLAQHVGAFEQQLENARACPAGFHRLQVRLPVSGSYAVGCFNTPNPCDDTVRRAENALLRDHARIGHLEREVRTLRDHVTGVEQVVTTFFDCDTRDECVESAQDIRERVIDAYNGSIQLSGWALQQNQWDEAAVLEFQRLEREAGTARGRISDLEAWRRDIVDPKLQQLEQRINAVAAQARGTADTVAQNENRLTIDPHLSFIQATCGTGQDCWSMGTAGVTIDGRVTRTSQFFGQFNLDIGWGRTNRDWGTDVTVFRYGLGFGYRVGRFSISAGGQGISLLGSYVGGGTALTVWGPYARASVDLGPVQGHLGVGGGFGSGAGESGGAITYQFATVEAGLGFRFRAL